MIHEYKSTPQKERKYLIRTKTCKRKHDNFIIYESS